MEAAPAVFKRPFSGLGGSLPVPNVQALAASNSLSKEIPHRYIRPEVEDEVSFDDGCEEIPVLDLRRLLDPVDSHDEMNKFKTACEEWGFFQLMNHGVAEEVIERMKTALEDFFKLPLEEKQKVAQPPNTLEGYGQAFVVSEDQKLDWADMFFLATLPAGARNMKLWPVQPPNFRKSLDEFSSALREVSYCLLKLIARNLDIEPQTLLNMFSEGRQSIRMNYYPPCPKPSKALGVSPHSDAGGLTLLLQVNQVQGLQIKKNGKWMSVKPLPGAFTVNIGDSLEIITNGKYKSVEHRAMVNTEKERLSMAAFNSPNPDADIGPLEELVKRSKRRYKTINSREFMKMFISKKLDGKSQLYQMKLEE